MLFLDLHSTYSNHNAFVFVFNINTLALSPVRNPQSFNFTAVNYHVAAANDKSYSFFRLRRLPAECKIIFLTRACNVHWSRALNKGTRVYLLKPTVLFPSLLVAILTRCGSAVSRCLDDNDTIRRRNIIDNTPPELTRALLTPSPSNLY